MKTLDEIAIKRGTDKATTHPTGAHGYTPHYDRAFQDIRNKPVKVLEVGVGGGESIMMWLDYFPKADVIGVDISEHTNEWNDPTESPNSRYRFYKGDQTSSDFWKSVEKKEKAFDVIVDDGGHRNDQIIVTFCSLWFLLNPMGFYCIEDLGVCYTSGSVFVVPAYPSHSNFLKAKLDEIMQGQHNIDWMSLSKELVIIRKK